MFLSAALVMEKRVTRASHPCSFYFVLSRLSGGKETRDRCGSISTVEEAGGIHKIRFHYLLSHFLCFDMTFLFQESITTFLQYLKNK